MILPNGRPLADISSGITGKSAYLSNFLSIEKGLIHVIYVRQKYPQAILPFSSRPQRRRDHHMHPVPRISMIVAETLRLPHDARTHHFPAAVVKGRIFPGRIIACNKPGLRQANGVRMLGPARDHQEE